MRHFTILHTLKWPSRYTMGRLTGVASIHICMQLSFHDIFLTFFEEYRIAISFFCTTLKLHYSEDTGA